jgi:hypothetical protein
LTLVAESRHSSGETSLEERHSAGAVSPPKSSLRSLREMTTDYKPVYMSSAAIV